MGSPPGDEAAYRLAYEAVLRTLDEQRITLRDVRRRSANLLTVAFGAVAVISSLVLSAEKDPGVVGYAGLTLAGASGIAVLVCAACVWRPVEGLGVNEDGAILAKWADEGVTVADICRRQANSLEKRSKDIRKLIDARLKVFKWALWAIVPELIGLALLIGDMAHGTGTGSGGAGT